MTQAGQMDGWIFLMLVFGALFTIAVIRRANEPPPVMVRTQQAKMAGAILAVMERVEEQDAKIAAQDRELKALREREATPRKPAAREIVDRAAPSLEISTRRARVEDEKPN